MSIEAGEVHLDAALASPVFNITLGSFVQIACMECGKPVRKRFPVGRDAVEAQCFECRAGYRLTLADGGKVHWRPLQQEVVCPTDSCGHTFAIWDHEIERGAHWVCPKCQVRYRIDYAFFRDPTRPNFL